MRRRLVPTIVPLATALALACAACGLSTGPTPASTAGEGGSETPAPTGMPDGTPGVGPGLTPVPGGQSGEPEPLPTRIGTMQTEWGEILVALPATFPMYPGAGIVDLPETVSASFSAAADLQAVTRWYAEALSARGYEVELSEPLEDGSRILDVTSDLPECRIQMAFRPEPDSTIITVLYGAGCAGLAG